MKKYWWVLFIIGIALILIFIDKKESKSKLSEIQEEVEDQVGEGIITFKDSYTGYTNKVDFQNKQGQIKYGDNDSKTVAYTITDILQSFNIDNQGGEEYPFLMKAKYSDKETSYLIVVRWNHDQFVSVDQAEVGPPNQIDDIHELDERDVIIDAYIGEGKDKESVILSYTLENDKIIPGKGNIDLSTKPKPAPVPTPISTPTPTSTKTPSATPKDDSGDKIVYFTFDDGPGKYTPNILQILKDNDIKATFFMIGQNAEGRNDYVKQVHGDGHIIGNHTYDHQDMKKLSYDAQMDELTKTNNIIENIISGINVHYFRPPYGNYNDDTLNVLSKLGMEKVLWTVDPRDWSGISASDISNAVLSNVKNNAVVLMHDGVANSSETAKALPGIISTLKERGYKFKTIDQR